MIQLRNNYDKGVFNGSIGRIVAINTEKARVSVAFEETHAEYDLSELDELALAYAISVHKSQGSQYPAIVMPIHSSHYLMLRRNLLYTAITRAERVCVLVGTKSALQQAVRNQDERLRFSRLARACTSTDRSVMSDQTAREEYDQSDTTTTMSGGIRPATNARHAENRCTSPRHLQQHEAPDCEHGFNDMNL